ncbi:MAG TPA: hypothetical protein VFS20_19965 [Longimicrobium sp.]|nr:hypothetical protein [Longimicrobium sp.]
MEQIHAVAENQRQTQTIVAISMVAFASYALGDAALTGWSALSTAGVMVGTAGTALLQWVRHRAALTPKRLSL